MYAVINTGGKQYKVSEGDIVKVGKLGKEKGTKIKFDQVLLVSDGKVEKVGAPFLKGTSVEAMVVENNRERKIRVFKKRRRKGYRKTIGHRTCFSKVKIEKIIQ